MPNASGVRTWPAQRCSRSTDWCWRSRTCPIPQLNSVVVDRAAGCARRAMEAARARVRATGPSDRDRPAGRSQPRRGRGRSVDGADLDHRTTRDGVGGSGRRCPRRRSPHGIEIRPVMSDEDVRGLVEVGGAGVRRRSRGRHVLLRGGLSGVGRRASLHRVEGRGTGRDRDRLPARGRRGGHGRRGGAGGSAARPGIGADGSGGASVPRRRDSRGCIPRDEARSMYGRLGFRRVADYEIWMEPRRRACLRRRRPRCCDRPAGGRA